MKDPEALLGIASSDVSVRALRPFLGALRSAGIDEAELLRRAQIEPTTCNDDEARVDLDRAQAFWDAVPVAAGDDRIGLRAGDYAQPELFYSPNDDPPLPGAELELSITGDRGAFRIRYRVAMPRVISDCWIAAGARFARDLTGGPWPLTEVHFAYPRPRDAAAYETFFGLPVHFGQELDALVFPASMLELRLRGSNVPFCPALESRANDAPALLTGAPFTTRVARVLGDQLATGATDVAHVAEQLAMSPRTLRRRLRAEGTHHGQLLDQLRHEAAARYLAEGRAVAEVASLLGFAHPSTFSAAFKRWTGKAPRRAR
jgi:AraC-like DNA-binding protein